MGDNGLFDRTSKSKENAVLAQEEDQIRMAWDALVYDQTTEIIAEDTSEENLAIRLQEELSNNGNNTTTRFDDENAFYEVAFGTTHHTYLVDLDGNVSLKTGVLDYWVTFNFGNESFNGSRYLNTGIQLFNTSNVNRDFEISMDVSNFTPLAGQDTNRNVILCNQNESGSPYQGFCFQYRENALTVQANNTGIGDYQQPWDKTEGNIVFKRKKKVLYRDKILLCDYADNIIPFDAPLTIGANLSDVGATRRFSKVDLSNITVKLKLNHREYIELCDSLPVPEKTQNIFLGWYSAPDGSGTKITTTEQLEAAGGVLYPHWAEAENAITVTFAANDGSGRTSRQILPYNSSENLDLNTFTKEGSDFLNWNTVDNGTGTKYLNGANVTLTDDVTLYAQWLARPQTSFTANNLTFNGKVSSIVDTGVCLFSSENIHKNFEIYLEVGSVGTGNVTQAVLMNTKDEAGGSPWPGIVFRVNGSKLQLKADRNSGTNNTKSLSYNLNDVQKLRIIRINDITYYSVNDASYQVLMDFTSIIRTFDSPVAFGGIVKPDGKRDRPFKGTLTTASVRFISDDATLEEYQNALP